MKETNKDWLAKVWGLQKFHEFHKCTSAQVQKEINYMLGFKIS